MKLVIPKLLASLALGALASTALAREAGKTPRQASTKELQRKKQLGIPYGDCVEIENKVGQLLFIFVDGNGTNPRRAVHPEYIKAVADMNIGGVRLNSDAGAKASVRMYREAVEGLDRKVSTPLFIGIDNANTTFIAPQRFSEIAIGKRVKALASMKEMQETLRAISDPKERETVLRENAIQQLEKEWLDGQKKEKGWGRSFGLGTFKGIIGNMGQKSRECFDRALYLDAFLHTVIHANTALGPTIDPSNRDKEWLNWWSYLSTESRENVARRGADVLDTFGNFGLATTLKHFPYTPVHFNLHYMNKAVKDSPEEVREVVKIFPATNKLAKEEAPFVMTTHLYNPNFDSTIATTSKKWLSLLREELGYKGIIVTDGINMVNASQEIEGLLKKQWSDLKGGPVEGNDSLFAILSILAGNDMVIVDSSLSTTKKVFSELLKTACQDGPVSKELRDRIRVSYDRINGYKEKHAAELKRRAPMPDSDLLRDILSYYDALNSPGDSCPSQEEFAALKKKIQALGTTAAAKKDDDSEKAQSQDAR